MSTLNVVVLVLCVPDEYRRNHRHCRDRPGREIKHLRIAEAVDESAHDGCEDSAGILHGRIIDPVYCRAVPGGRLTHDEHLGYRKKERGFSEFIGNIPPLLSR